MNADAIVASRKRILLALYLDLILFMVPWGWANYLLRDGELHFGVGVLVFAVIRFATRRLGASPGMHMLSVGRDRTVDPMILARENWLTMLLGALFVLQGAKQLVNWIYVDVPEPFFGFMPGQTAQVAIHLSAGILLVSIGYLYFKMVRQGFWLAALAVSGSLVSCVVSWSHWMQTVPEMAIARRALQGRVVSEQELEFMRAVMPIGFVVLYGVILVAVLVTSRRFFAPAPGKVL